jgi:hypothetical protein
MATRRDDLDSRNKAQPIMAPRSNDRDTEAEYMTARHRRTKSYCQKLVTRISGGAFG